MSTSDLREMLAGSLGGASACVIEYPLDTIKVRLQDGGKKYTSVMSCIQNIARNEGIINGFFRGLPAPVLGAALENAVLFLVYRFSIESFESLVCGRCSAQDTEPYVAVATAGAIGGLAVSQVLTPAELIKCKMQVQNTLPPDDRIYRNSIDCVKATYARRGIRGLFRGHVAMMIREAVGCALYFVLFQCVTRSFLREGQTFHDVSPAVHLLAGGCAGVGFWTSTYPVDAVKTKQQTLKADYLKLNFRQCCTRLYRTEGMRGFFRGYTVTALRAFPGNAVLIAVYEQVNIVWDAVAR